MQRFIFTGNLTRDPESGTTSSGVSYCKFTVAVNRSFSKEKEVDYFNVVTWRGTADSCSRNLIKGKKVCVIGRIQQRTYQTNSGENRTAYDVVADEVEFLSPSKSTENTEQSPKPKEEYRQQRIEDLPQVNSSDEDLPF